MIRRTALLTALGSLVILATGAIGYVLLGSLAPSADKSSRELDVGLGDIPRNSYKVVHWLNLPVAVYRGESQVHVYYFQSPVSGCELREVRRGDHRGDRTWMGGYVDPCRYGEWDYSGKALNRPGSTPGGERVMDLLIPAYERVGTDRIRLKMPT